MKKTAEYVNVYENLQEAHRRLSRTVVLYDGEPYKIHAITDHIDDVFRAYIEPMDTIPNALGNKSWNGYFPAHEYGDDFDDMGEKMDEWMADNKGSPILRKKLNSPKFNRFRPFDLGMANHEGDVYYLERQPLRKGEQGLIGQSVTTKKVLLVPDNTDDSPYAPRGMKIPFQTRAFRNCVVGEYPTAVECVTNLNDESIGNTGAAFHRKFAFIRGPLGSLYLAYKTDIIGFLPSGGLDLVRIDTSFRHLIETVEELSVFETIKIGIK